MITTIALILAATALRPHGAEATPRDVAVRPLPPSGAASSLTLNAMPFTRTVTCSGDYELTGTFTGTVPTWSASPSGASGSCSDTGGGTFSCVVEVLPDATGEGVETITVTNGASDTETIGFYVTDTTGDTASELHTCFNAQNIDGSYNSTLANLDAVTTWDNNGTSALDVTQSGAASLKPTYRTSIVGGQPVVRCDGGDRLFASTASDWTFLSNGTDWTVEHVGATSAANPNVLQVVVATADANATSNRGTLLGLDDRSGSSRNDRISAFMSSGAAFILNATSADGVAPQQKFNLGQWTLDEGGATEFVALVNGSSGISTASVTGYSASAPQFALNLCTASTTFPLTGDLFRIAIYQSALNSTQRGINQAVDEWALGGTLPVTP